MSLERRRSRSLGAIGLGVVLAGCSRTPECDAQRNEPPCASASALSSSSHGGVVFVPRSSLSAPLAVRSMTQRGSTGAARGGFGASAAAHAAGSGS